MTISPFKKTYGNFLALDFPGMTLEAGRIYAVVGSNGSGKSTFAKTVAGIEKADEGRTPLRLDSVGYMPQRSYAFRMSLEDNVLLNSKDRQRAQTLLSALHLSQLKDKRADKLSGGETARMALARILMRPYSLLILDEPTAAMDMESTILSEKLIKSYVQENSCPLILITHSIQQARRLSDYMLYFDKAQLIEQSETKKMLSSPEYPRTKDFLSFYGC